MMESINRQKDDEGGSSKTAVSFEYWKHGIHLKPLEYALWLEGANWAARCGGGAWRHPSTAARRRQSTTNRVPWPLSTPESAMSWWQLESFLSWRLVGFANVSSKDQRQRETSRGSTLSLAATRQPSQEKINFRDDIGISSQINQKRRGFYCRKTLVSQTFTWGRRWVSDERNG